MNAPRTVLVIAGHDPSGGAGLDADREALADRGLTIWPVCTAATDQDAHSFRSLGARAVHSWREEALAALEHQPRALKFGLLPGRAHLRAAAELVQLARARWGTQLPVVVDPVLGSSTGGRFLDDEGIGAYLPSLLELGLVWTPNLPEAAQLGGLELERLTSSLEARVELAQAWIARGARGVLIKGGHGREDPVQDLVVAAGRAPAWNSHFRVPGGKLRGSGCRYASHLAAGLALGATLEEAAAEASKRVFAALRAQARG